MVNSVLQVIVRAAAVILSNPHLAHTNGSTTLVDPVFSMPCATVGSIRPDPVDDRRWSDDEEGMRGGDEVDDDASDEWVASSSILHICVFRRAT